jgi:hypothetical protein
MFKSASYKTRNVYGNSIHSIVDDTFQYLVETNPNDGAVSLLISIILEYRRRCLPIAPNVALFYLWQPAWCAGRSKNLIKIMETDRALVDARCVSIKYSTSIYPCVLRQIEQRRFGK